MTDFYPNPQTDKIEAVLSLTDKSLNAVTNRQVSAVSVANHANMV